MNEEVYLCDQCGAEFDDGDEYAAHVATHEPPALGVAVSDGLAVRDKPPGSKT